MVTDFFVNPRIAVQLSEWRNRLKLKHSKKILHGQTPYVVNSPSYHKKNGENKVQPYAHMSVPSIIDSYEKTHTSWMRAVFMVGRAPSYGLLAFQSKLSALHIFVCTRA